VACRTRPGSALCQFAESGVVDGSLLDGTFLSLEGEKTAS
jgi:hypothetical protein